MSAPFTDEEHAFLRGILTNPADLTGWLAYADWLDERSDPRAEYLRLQVRRGELRPEDPELAAVDDRLRNMREEFNPYWVAFFDRPPVEHCLPEFSFKCPKQWQDLAITPEVGVRHCGDCRQSVYYCDSLSDAQDHARQGRCVAVSLAVARYPGDLGDVPVVVNMVGLMLPDPPPVRRRPWWKFW